MNSRGRQRPKRGASPRDNGLVEIIEGDNPPYGEGYGPQGEPGPFPYFGDEPTREFGTPDADIPGGLKHLINKPTAHKKPPATYERPADYHKYHGVAPTEPGHDYDRPVVHDEEASRRARPVPEPKVHEDAVPVRIVAEEGEDTWIKKTMAFNIRVNKVQAGDVTRICDRDPHRLKLKVLNEDSSTDIRVSNSESELEIASAQGTGIAGEGALIYHATNTYTDLEDCQDAMFAVTTSTTLTALLSVIIVTAVPAAHGVA